MSCQKFTETPGWRTAALPLQLCEQDCHVGHRSGADRCPHCTADRIAVYLDYENLHIGLEHTGYTPDPATLIAAARKEFAGLGRVVEIHAVGDWGELTKNGEVKVSNKLLKASGATPEFVRSINGKSSADLVITSRMQTQVDRPTTAPNAADVFVIGTCDRDFRVALQYALDHGKRVRLLSLRRGISRYLANLVGPDNVRYLEPYFAQWSSYPKWGASSDQQFSLVLRTVAYLRQQQYQQYQKFPWVSVDQLVHDLGLGSDGERQVQQAAADKLFKLEPRRGDNAVSPDLNHPDTYGADWLYRYLGARLNWWKMKYVGTSFIKRGMHEDLQPLGADCSWEGLNWFLKRAAVSGVVMKKTMKVRSHPEYPGNRIDTWWLAAAAEL